MSSSDPLSRREFLSLAAKLSALGLGAGALGGCTSPAAEPQGGGGGGGAAEPREVRRAKVRQNAIDYRKARAVPTICFGCTTACGVIGWVQDGRVRKIDGNPLDDLRLSEAVAHTVLGGRVYDSATMDQQWPTVVERPPLSWEASRGSVDPSSASGHSCGCGRH